jgi:hypothetical protein
MVYVTSKHGLKHSLKLRKANYYKISYIRAQGQPNI